MAEDARSIYMRAKMFIREWEDVGISKRIKSIDSLVKEWNANYTNIGEDGKFVQYILSGDVGRNNPYYKELYKAMVGEDLKKEEIIGKYATWEARIRFLDAYLNIARKTNKQNYEILIEYAKDMLKAYTSYKYIKIRDETSHLITKYINTLEKYEKVSFKDTAKKVIVGMALGSILTLGISGVFNSYSEIPSPFNETKTTSTLINNQNNNSTIAQSNSTYSKVTKKNKIKSEQNTSNKVMPSISKSSQNSISPEELLEKIKEKYTKEGADVIIKKDGDKYIVWVDKKPERYGLWKKGVAPQTKHLAEDVETYIKKFVPNAHINTKVIEKQEYKGYGSNIDLDRDGKSDIRVWYASIKKKIKGALHNVKEHLQKSKKSETSSLNLDLLDGKKDNKLWGAEIKGNFIKGAVEYDNIDRQYEIKGELKKKAEKSGWNIEISKIEQKGKNDIVQIEISNKNGEKYLLNEEHVHIENKGLYLAPHNLP